MIFDAFLCMICAVVAAIEWNNPSQQFNCGMSFALAIWCGLDFLKAALVRT